MRMTKKDPTADTIKEEEPRKQNARFLRSLRRTKDSPNKKRRGVFRSSKHAPLEEARDGPEEVASMDATHSHTAMLTSEEVPTMEATHSRTAILTSYDPLQQKQRNPSPEQHTVPTTASAEVSQPTSMTLATAILQQSYHLCGRQDDVFDQSDDEDDMDVDDFPRIPEDPTIEESIECVFASQLEEGLPFLHMDEEYDDEDDDVFPAGKELMSPAMLLQSRENRSGRIVTKSAPPRPKPQYRAGSLVHLGTYNHKLGAMVAPPEIKPVPEATSLPVHECPCKRGIRTPQVPPEYWPQGPLLMRPTPGTGMRVLGIRFSSSTEYLWKEGDANDGIVWAQKLHQHWNKSCALPEKLPACCPECMVLPINNGTEPNGESLVVDFESPLFRGTLLARVRYSEGTTKTPYDDSKGYFAGMNRRYQVVIRGKFLDEIPWTQLVAGLELERPCGKLPPKWITKGALKVVSFFAPQLKANFDVERPYSLTPLGSTPQSLRVEDHAHADASMEEMQHEPNHASHSLLGEVSDNPSSLGRARFRKKNFDKLYVGQSLTPTTDRHRVHTFEFLQHLLDFHDFSVELGSLMGQISLKDTLDGQPLQIMSRHVNGPRIWAFDVWHQCLVEDSLRHDAMP